jgi:hypothetical protein
MKPFRTPTLSNDLRSFSGLSNFIIFCIRCIIYRNPNLFTKILMIATYFAHSTRNLMQHFGTIYHCFRVKMSRALVIEQSLPLWCSFYFRQIFLHFQDGTILPPETVVPAFSRVAGSPGRPVGELPECSQVAQKFAYPDPLISSRSGSWIRFLSQ